MKQEDFWKNWELEWLEQIKVGDEIISEVNFAVPKWAKNKAWELLNNSVDLEEIVKISNSFDFFVDNVSFCWRITKKLNEDDKK